MTMVILVYKIYLRYNQAKQQLTLMMRDNMRFENNKYILYTKDRPILSFRCERGLNDEPVFIQESTFDSIRPFCFEDIGTWVENRRAPKHRSHIKELLEKCGCNDLEGFIRFGYCAGLNDTFWIRPEEINLRWDDISLYRNEFDENIARLAFGTGLMGEEFTSTTPELVTDGTFPKCWKRFDNEVFLLKQGSSGASNTGREPFSELYAYLLSKEICDNPLPYELIRFHGKLASKCKLFTTEDIGYTPALSFLGKNTSLEEMLSFFKGIGAEDHFKQMIVLDALTLNTDRHLKNFGFLYDNNTMDIIGMAPVFDNNLSLCPFAEISDLKDLDRYMPTRQCAIGDGFNESAIKCLTPDLKEKLYQLRSFRFEQQTKYSLPEERIALLEELIHKQAENLLHERVINIPLDTTDKITLSSLVMTFDTEDLSDELLTDLKRGTAVIPDFEIYMESGDILTISGCEYTVNEYNNKIEIDIYDSNVSGDASTLKIKGINGLGIEGFSGITAQIDVQLDKGSYSEYKTLSQYNLESSDDLLCEKIVSLFEEADRLDEWSVQHIFHPLSKVRGDEAALLKKQAGDLLLELKHPENILSKIPDKFQKRTQSILIPGGVGSGANDDHDEI